MPPINTRQDFTAFVKELHSDLKANPDEWENTTLETFLEALAAYAEDIQGYYDNRQPGTDADAPRWQTFADMLRGASVYE